MINHNGQHVSQTAGYNNRGFRLGDALFETLKVVNSKIYFWEDHYLRLMAAMRIIRMEIPMTFTMEFLETQILQLLQTKNLAHAPVRVRLTVYREGEGHYLPATNTVSYIIEASPLPASPYTINTTPYTIELFKDHYVTPGLLSTLKTNNRILNIIGSIFAKENQYDNCLLLNQEKNVVEALNANLFIVTGNQVKTPPLTDGCLNGILRKQLLKLVPRLPGYTLHQASVSPFELQKADELFITNVITGIQPVTRYRKKEYRPTLAPLLIDELNQTAEKTSGK